MATAAALRSPAREEVERAFDFLYRRHVADVLGYTRSVIGDPDAAEDLAQSTFLKAYRALGDGVWPDQPREWLITIARNECGMHFRSESRRPQEAALDEELVVPEGGDARADEVREALQHLGDNQRRALVMRELEDRSYDEIAAALELSPSAVETLLFRARRALREQIEAATSCEDARRLIAASPTLTDGERAELRAHVRSCEACATLERKRRGLRSMLGRVASLLPLPSWLPSLFGGAAAKSAAVVAAATVTAGGTATVVTTAHHHHRHQRVPAKPAVHLPSPTRAHPAAVASHPAPPVHVQRHAAARPPARVLRHHLLKRLHAALSRTGGRPAPPAFAAAHGHRRLFPVQSGKHPTLPHPKHPGPAGHHLPKR